MLLELFKSIEFVSEVLSSLQWRTVDLHGVSILERSYYVVIMDRDIAVNHYVSPWLTIYLPATSV